MGYSFTHHRVDRQTDDGFEITLFINPNMEEFSKELGSLQEKGKVNIEQEAREYVKKTFPNTKVKIIKIVGGAVLLTTLAFGPIKPTTVEAASPNIVEAQQMYTVKSGDTLWNLANRHNTTIQAIMNANNLPSDFLRIGQTLVIPSSTQATIQYTVVAGDTLSGIAARNGTTVNDIRTANNLTSDLIRVGQSLTVPTNGGSTSAPTVSQPNQSTFTYTVVAGDTLSGIAARNGTTVNTIMTTNNLTSDFLRIGQQLTIPGSGTTQTAPVAPPTQTAPTQTYIVVSGDTLSGIASRNGTTVNAIKTTNNLTSDFLRIGQALVIPSGGGTAAEPVRSSPPTETSINQEELLWLAKMIFAEARGESLQGQIAVGAVIMNRVKSNLFPNTIHGVIFEKSHGHYQFTPAGTGSIHTATPNSTQMEAARRAMAGEDPTNGSLFFYNPTKTNDQWVRSRTVSTTIGNHVFAF